MKKRFPIYFVRKDGKFCGHQHQHKRRAERCAANLPRGTKPFVQLFKVLKDGTEVHA